MDEPKDKAKSKKKVTFGKAKIRLLYDYDTDETTSREVATVKEKPPQQQFPQKQPKSILKPTTRASSLDSGLNEVWRLPKRMGKIEWEKSDRNFWEPAKHKRSGRKRQISRSENNVSTLGQRGEQVSEKRHKTKVKLPTINEIETTSKVDQKAEVVRVTDAKTKPEFYKKDENNNDYSEEDTAFRSGSAETNASTGEKQEVKNGARWQGIKSQTRGRGLKTFVGIYSGVEADWEETRHSLSKIGVDVGGEKLQNPRDFVEIMNMLLSKEKAKSDNQSEKENFFDPQHNAETNKFGVAQKDSSFDSNSSCKSEEGHTSRGETDEKISKGQESQRPTPSKDELRKRIKRLRMKGLIPKKKENLTKKDKSYSEDNLNYPPRTDSKESYSSWDRFISGNWKSDKKKQSKRSCSEDNLDFFSKLESEKSKNSDESCSKEDVCFDTEMKCSSTDTDTYRGRSYSDNNLDLPKGKSVDGNVSRTRSATFSGEKESGGDDLLARKNQERRKLVKKDPWFLTRKQKMKSESDPNLDERSNPKDKPKEKRNEGLDSEQKQGDITQRKPSDEVQNDSTSDTEMKCSSTDTDTYRKRSYSDKNLDLPKGKSVDGNVNRTRSATFSGEKENGGDDLLARKNQERPKLVKKDSWFLTRKQKMKSESDPNLDERSNPKDKPKEKRNEGLDSEQKQGDITQRKPSDEVQNDSTSESDFDNKNRSSEQTDHLDIPQNRQTLLVISNNSSSEKDATDSGLSSTSLDIPNAQEYKQNTSKTIEPQSATTECKQVPQADTRCKEIAQQSQVEEIDKNKTTDNQEELEIARKNEPESAKSETAKKDCNQQSSKDVSEITTPNATDSGLSSTSLDFPNAQEYKQNTSKTVEQQSATTECKQVPQADTRCKEIAQQSQVEEIDKNKTTGNQEELEIARKNEPESSKSETAKKDCNQQSSKDDFLVEKQFQNDICFINAETKKSLKSDKYVEKAREKNLVPKTRTASCFPEKVEINLAHMVTKAISKNPAAGLFIPFLYYS